MQNNDQPSAQPYDGPERRRNPIPLTDEHIERIAEVAADKAVQKMTEGAYKAIGRGVVSKLLWVIGVLTTAAFIWAAKAGWVK